MSLSYKDSPPWTGEGNIDTPPLGLNPVASFDSQYLSALLTCYGARADENTRRLISQRQNPYGQKRGGLGYGAFLSIRPQIKTLQVGQGSVQAGIVNVNLYATRQAALSPIELKALDPEARFLTFQSNGKTVATASVPRAPLWLGAALSDGTPVATVLQAHGPNLVSVWGRNRCELFDQGSACSFCMFDGGANNATRSMPQVIEAIAVMQSTTEGQAGRRKNLTLTTGMLGPNKLEALARDVDQFKQAYPDFRLALETNPFPEESRADLRRLRDAGLDTLMIPLDCYSVEAQKRFLAGKATALQRDYWSCVSASTEIFPANNVTSSIIVGLEDKAYTVEAMRRMAKVGVVPEPLPVRWNDERMDDSRPLTDPRDLIAVRGQLDEIFSTMAAGGPLAGCASCGGCTGLKKKS
jgi:hypothetical protein